MKSFLLLSLTLGLATITLACSGGGGRPQLSGTQCPENYKPVPTDLDPKKNKASKKLSISEQLPIGEYVYQGAVFFYTNADGLEVMAHDSRELNGKTFTTTVSCMRNRGKATDETAITIPGISHMKITQTGAEIEMRDYSLSFKQGRPIAKATVNESSKPVSPEEAYRNVADEKFIVSHPRDVYEIRSFANGVDGTSYSLRVSFKRVDLKDTGAEEPPPAATVMGHQ